MKVLRIKVLVTKIPNAAMMTKYICRCSLIPLGDDGGCSGDAIVRGDVGLLFLLIVAACGYEWSPQLDELAAVRV